MVNCKRKNTIYGIFLIIYCLNTRNRNENLLPEVLRLQHFRFALLGENQREDDFFGAFQQVERHGFVPCSFTARFEARRRRDSPAS